MGKIVIVAALDATFQRKPFGKILELIPLAEKVSKLTAICVRCGDEACFTQRISKETHVELIGGEETYRPLCRLCFNMPIEEGAAQGTCKDPVGKAKAEENGTAENSDDATEI